MARTKTMGVKNPSYSLTSKSETSHSYSPKTHQDKGKDKAIEVSSWSDSKTTMTITPPRAKVIVIGSSKKKSFVKAEKSRKKMKRSEYEVVTLFNDKKLKEKFDKIWANKKVVYDKYIDLLEIK